jgi:hypothetical protein
LHGLYGLQAQIVTTTGRYVRDDTPNAEARYRARFTFDPNSTTTAWLPINEIQPCNARSTAACA